MTEVQRAYFWHRFLNPYALEGYAST